MKLVDKHFKHDNKLHEIFNRKTLKISYSCTKNIFQIINSHNKVIIKDFQDRTNNNDNNNNNGIKKECNCKSQKNCPMNGLCNLNNVVYQGIIYPKENITDRKTYIGISSMKWKERYANHKYSFPHKHLKHQTALSKQFWSNRSWVFSLKKVYIYIYIYREREREESAHGRVAKMLDLKEVQSFILRLIPLGKV